MTDNATTRITLSVAALFWTSCGGIAEEEPDAGLAEDASEPLDAANDALWQQPNILPISMPGNEFSCSLRGDGLELTFAGAPGLPNLDLFRSSRASLNDPFRAPRAIDELNDGGAQDFTPFLSADGLTMWMTSTRIGGPGGSDIYVATRTSPSAPWSTPTLVAELSSADEDGALAVSESGLIGVFHSRRPGGPGGLDLYEARRSSATAPWTSIVQLVAVNSDADEGGGWLSPDGLDLYFFSSRNGRQDLFIATRTNQSDQFGAPEEISEINSAGNEPYPCLSADQRVMIFARSDSDQQYDLFETRR